MADEKTTAPVEETKDVATEAPATVEEKKEVAVPAKFKSLVEEIE